MISHIIKDISAIILQSIAFFFLMLTAGVSYWFWFSFTQPSDSFAVKDLIAMAVNTAQNFQAVLSGISVTCTFFMALCLWGFPQKESIWFCFNVTSFIYTLVVLLTTTMFERSILHKLSTCPPDKADLRWYTIRDKWQFVCTIRLYAVMASLVCFLISVVGYFEYVPGFLN